MELFYAWTASIASGFTPIVIKASSKSLIKNAWLFNILWIACSIPLVVIYALIAGGGMPKDWTYIILMSASYAAFYICYTASLYRIDVSVMAPLFSLRTLFAVLLGVIFLHEDLSLLNIVLIVLIVLVSPFSAYNEKLRFKAFFDPAVLLAVHSMFVLALVGYFTNRSVAINGYASTLLWQDILVLLFLLPTLKFAQIKQQSFGKSTILPLVFLGIFDFTYTATATAAYAANLAISSVIVSLPLSMLFAAILSVKYGELLESNSFKVYAIRFSAAGVMVGSAILLSAKYR